MKKLLCSCTFAVACLFFIALAFAPTVEAQQTLGTINGTVTDISGAAMASCTVTVVNEQTGLARSTTTQKTGYWEILNLPVGTYKVTVTEPNFETVNYPSIAVRERSRGDDQRVAEAGTGQRIRNRDRESPDERDGYDEWVHA